MSAAQPHKFRKFILQSLLDLATDDGINASSKEEIYGCIFGRDSALTILKILRVHRKLPSETDMIILPFLAQLSQKHIPNIMTVHSRWPFDRHSATDEMFLKLYASKILAVNISASMHKTLPKQFRDGGFVHNSLDLTKMKFNGKPGAYLTWLGKIIPEKGTVEAIKAAKKMGEQFIFAGVVDKYLDTSVRYFKEKIKPLIDGKQIQYLGPADLKLKNNLLSGAKAFLNPIHWYEPFHFLQLLQPGSCCRINY